MTDLTKEIKEIASKMLPKHVAFAEAYLVTPIAKTAYIEIYGPKKNPNSAEVNGCKLLRHAKVRQYLDLRFKERASENVVDPNFLIKKCLKIIHSDYGGQTLLFSKEDLDALDKETRQMIQGTKIKKRYDGNGDLEIEYELTFMSKDKAMDMLGKMNGAYLKKIELSGDIGIKTFADIARTMEDEDA